MDDISDSVCNLELPDIILDMTAIKDLKDNASPPQVKIKFLLDIFFCRRWILILKNLLYFLI